jgi:hypothetical protein
MKKVTRYIVMKPVPFQIELNIRYRKYKEPAHGVLGANNRPNYS